MNSTNPNNPGSEFKVLEDPTLELVFSTVRLTAVLQNSKFSTGTGFYFDFCRQSDGIHFPAIVTNKHVLEGAQTIQFFFRRATKDLLNPILGSGLPIELTGAPEWVIPHPDPNIDLCIIPIAQVIINLVTEGAPPWMASLDTDMLLKSDDGIKPNAIEEILMVGYPNGLWDQQNDMPIIRIGITASHPALKWNGRNEFLIDAACFPGSSGSPVFLRRKRPIITRGGPGELINYRLLGVMYAGPQHTVVGTLETVTPATPSNTIFTRATVPNNLGIVTKANSLLYFEEYFKEMLDRRDFTHAIRSTPLDDRAGTKIEGLH